VIDCPNDRPSHPERRIDTSPTTPEQAADMIVKRILG
jgi:hypothetical protein